MRPYPSDRYRRARRHPCSHSSWRLSRRDWLLGGMLALGGPLLLGGCSQLDVNSQSPEDEIDELETNVRTVSDFATPFGFYPVKLQGLALVTQLRGTGGDSPPSMLRDALRNELKVRGVEHPDKLLASTSTAMVLAVGYLRPGIRKGDHFDVTVQVPPNDPTTSLRGGFLMETRLTELQARDDQLFDGRLLGLAKGPVFVDPLADEAKDKKAALTGKVLGGGVATIDRDLGLAIKSNVRSLRVSDQLARTINLRFHIYDGGLQQGVATAKTDEFIELLIPPRYKDNLARYSAVIKAISVRESMSERTARLKLLERQLLDPVTAGKAAIALEAIGQGGIDTLLKGLASNDPEVRFYAAEALAYLDQPQAAVPLAEAAVEEPAFRVFALAGLAAMQDIAGYSELLKLLHVPSAETRYGAFRALWTAHPNDPKFRGEGLSQQFSFHVIGSPAAPMIHLTSSFRPEVVLFGREHRFIPPCVIEVGKHMLVNVRGEDEVVVSRVEVGADTQRRVVPNDVDAVIRAAADLGANYGDVAQMLHIAKAKRALSSRLEVDALPQAGRTYRRRTTRPDEESPDGELRVASPTPDLYLSEADKPRRRKPSDGSTSGTGAATSAPAENSDTANTPAGPAAL